MPRSVSCSQSPVPQTDGKPREDSFSDIGETRAREWGQSHTTAQLQAIIHQIPHMQALKLIPIPGSHERDTGNLALPAGTGITGNAMYSNVDTYILASVVVPTIGHRSAQGAGLVVGPPHVSIACFLSLSGVLVPSCRFPPPAAPASPTTPPLPAKTTSFPCLIPSYFFFFFFFFPCAAPPVPLCGLFSCTCYRWVLSLALSTVFSCNNSKAHNA